MSVSWLIPCIHGYGPAVLRAHCWLHPGRTLKRSVEQRLHHFKSLCGVSVVVIHIGTNDIGNGLTADGVVKEMARLVESISSCSIEPFLLCCLVLLIVTTQKAQWRLALLRWSGGVHIMRTWCSWEHGRCLFLKSKFVKNCMEVMVCIWTRLESSVCSAFSGVFLRDFVDTNKK